MLYEGNPRKFNFLGWQKNLELGAAKYVIFSRQSTQQNWKITRPKGALNGTLETGIVHMSTGALHHSFAVARRFTRQHQKA